MRLEIETQGATDFAQLPMDRLDMYIHASDAVASHLQELLHESLLGIVVHDAQDPTRVHGYLSAHALRAEGYEQSQSLLPYSHRAFQGHRLLHEYFAFPPRFRFFSIQGLASSLQMILGRRLAMTLLLRKAAPDLEPVVDRQNFLLHCTPAINLFERMADRIHVSAGVNEYHVVMERTRPRDFEVYNVLSVTGHQEGQVNDREFVPLYASVHGIRSDDQAYFAVRREPRLFSEHAVRFGPRTQYLGSEVFLSLVDQRAAPFSDDLKQLSVRTLCTVSYTHLTLPTICSV